MNIHADVGHVVSKSGRNQTFGTWNDLDLDSRRYATWNPKHRDISTQKPLETFGSLLSAEIFLERTLLYKERVLSFAQRPQPGGGLPLCNFCVKPWVAFPIRKDPRPQGSHRISTVGRPLLRCVGAGACKQVWSARYRSWWDCWHWWQPNLHLCMASCGFGSDLCGFYDFSLATLGNTWQHLATLAQWSLGKKETDRNRGKGPDENLLNLNAVPSLRQYICYSKKWNLSDYCLMRLELWKSHEIIACSSLQALELLNLSSWFFFDVLLFVDLKIAPVEPEEHQGLASARLSMQLTIFQMASTTRKRHVQSIQRHVAHPGNQQNLLQLWNISWCALSLSLSLLSLFNRVSNLLELFVETFQPWRSERRITGLGRGAQNGSKARCKGTAAFILTSYSGTMQSTAD